MSYEGDVFIRGYRPVHSAEVSTVRVDETVTNFKFQAQMKDIRDLLIENLGPADCYLRFSNSEINTITIPDLTIKNKTFSGDAIGWCLRPDRPFSLSAVDFTHIGLVVNSGDVYTDIQIMAALYA